MLKIYDLWKEDCYEKNTYNLLQRIEELLYSFAHTLCMLCVTERLCDTTENLRRMENFNREGSPTESYEVVSSLFMAYISRRGSLEGVSSLSNLPREVLRCTKFSAVAQRSAAILVLNSADSPVLVSIINSSVVSLWKIMLIRDIAISIFYNCCLNSKVK